MDDTSGLDIKNGRSFSNPNYHLNTNDVNFNNNEDDEETSDLLDSEGSVCEETIYQELESSPICRLNRNPSIRNRRNYAHLNIGSMGVDLNSDPLQKIEQTPLLSKITNPLTIDETSSPSADRENNLNSDKTETSNNVYNKSPEVDGMVRRTKFIGDSNTTVDSPNIERQDSIKPSDEMCRSLMDTSMTSPDSCCSSNSASVRILNTENNIPHMHGQINDDLYAIPVKFKHSPTDGRKFKHPSSLGTLVSVHTLDNKQTVKRQSSDDEILPHGWEKHEDSDGPYFWHIKSGTIQREQPTFSLTPSFSQQDIRQLTTPTSCTPTAAVPPLIDPHDSFSITTTTANPVFPNISDAIIKMEKTTINDNEFIEKRHGAPSQSILSNDRQNLQSDKKVGNKSIRFAVRSLGWVEIAEEDLTPDRSSKAVNKCIVDLSHGKNDILDAVGRWGEGKDLFMDLDDHSLQLISPDDLTTLNTQPIHTIRVWGVGRDNGRDFAYVARDRITRKHMCHVFRCDTPARTIANTLRDICKRIMIERSMNHNLAKPVDTSSHVSRNHPVKDQTAGIHHGSTSKNLANSSIPLRPNNLPVEHKLKSSKTSYPAPQLFPTPMEEPKKVLKAYYLGTHIVNKPTGMEALNESIDKRLSAVPSDKWQYVNISIAPSTITVNANSENGKCLAECRVRFLSFLGIGKDVKNCAFIMHTAQDEFISHVFRCEPSSGAICKTIEAACKLRYQKCLDAHHHQGQEKNNASCSPDSESKSIGKTIRNMLGTLAGKKSKSLDS